MRAAHAGIIQQAWVVPDLDAAVRRWHERLGVGPFLINRGLRLDENRHRGIQSDLCFSTAVTESNGVQIELIEQHDPGPSAYRDLVPAGRTGFHHVAMIAAAFDDTVGMVASPNSPIAADGRFGDCRFAYVDTSASIGCMTEIIEDSDTIRRFFGAVRKAAERWDGDRATLFRELATS